MAIKLIEDHCKENKSAKILDYGCGTGIKYTLLLKGYKNVHGRCCEEIDNRILKYMT